MMNRSRTVESGEVKSAGRVLDILDLLAARGKLTLTEIAHAMRMPKSSTYGILKTALQRGYLNLDPATKDFSLGVTLLRIASRFPFNPDLITEFRKVSAGIVDQCDETVQLGILDGTDIVHISRTESSHPLRFITPIGRRYAAHTTGLGKVLLSALSDEQIDMLYGRKPLAQPTPNSISSVADLKRELQRVRRQKWATDHEETLIGLTCVAAPIYDTENKIIAAVSVSLPVARWSAQREGKLTQIVVRGARDISILMGAPARENLGVR